MQANRSLSMLLLVAACVAGENLAGEPSKPATHEKTTVVSVFNYYYVLRTIELDNFLFC